MPDYLMKQLTEVTFCAHDENETSLQFVRFQRLDGSIERQSWVLCDKRGLSIDFDTLTVAIVNMSILTQTDINDFTIL